VICGTRTVRIVQNTPQIQAMVLRRLLDAGAAIIALDPLESPLEQLYVEAVRAGAAAQIPAPPADDLRTPAITIPSPPPNDPTPPAARHIGAGDTLLNELLRRGGDQESEPGAGNREQGTGVDRADPQA
jgi:hypothetical protein